MVSSIGVMLPCSDVAGSGIADIPAAAVAYEQMGAGTVWTGDHLAFHAPMIDSTVALASAAAATSSVRVGFGVMLLALRPPAWAAKQISALQVLSGDRLVLGVGVGGENPLEWAAAGVPCSERGRRTDAVLAVLPALLSGQPAHLPEPYSLDVPALLPAGTVPPIWVGGRSDHALRRAATYGDGWLGMWADADRIARARSRLDELSAELERPRPSIALHVFVNVGRHAEATRADAAAFIEGQYRMSFSAVERYAALGAAGAIRDRLLTLRQAGVEQFLLHPAAADHRQQLDGIAELLALAGPEFD